MQVVVAILLALAMILFGAELFTNAVEWLGRRLGLSQGAVGSVLAALGTALPETAVPITAIILGGGSRDAQDVGIGGILGAPFLLATLGSLIMALAVLLVRRRSFPALEVNPVSFQRDMSFFLVAYSLALVVGVVRLPHFKSFAPWTLMALYTLFLFLTLRDRDSAEASGPIHPLYLQGQVPLPMMPHIMLQLLLSLGLIIGGAHLLSSGVEQIAKWLNIPPFILSALLIPLATELPETFNSVVWIHQGKDTLAVGNITGAMVFQSTLVPAIGILLTPWRLNMDAQLTGGLTLAAAAFVFGMFRMHQALSPGVLLCASLLYWVLPLQALALRYDPHIVYWVSGALLGAMLLLTLGMRARYRSEP
ncbi:MAG: sodium:calcium antiporter [Alicyclobacillus herbarius]|uniref:sodium:calcium antiporter n=1 Tax=Alicyclobacillus herbarius TaxID=122960 RepID=UPI002356AC92|nr:sodium:calcium antiporter [Alicyclobacillus herbarius]MCL6631032.1 sodium:calcium antiporter [Alicyclobacillus herbarius]